MPISPVINYSFVDGQAKNPDGVFFAEVHGCTYSPAVVELDGWGILNHTLQFTHPRDHVKLPQIERLEDTIGCTIELVIELQPSEFAIVGLFQGEEIPIRITIRDKGDGNSVIEVLAKTERSDIRLVADDWTLENNKWYAIGVVFTGADLVIFVDNQLIARRALQSDVLTPTPSMLLTNTTLGHISPRMNSFHGRIAGLRIYDDVSIEYQQAIKVAQESGIGEPTSKYLDLGGSESFLGHPISEELDIADGRMRQFSRGVVYWSRDNGAYALHSVFVAKYDELDGPQGFLGFPTSDLRGPSEESTVGVHYFEAGVIARRPMGEAHVLSGPILRKWLDQDGDWHPGYPSSDILSVSDQGHYCVCDRGNIYYSPSTGAVALRHKVLEQYIEMAGPEGYLGYPTSEEAPVRNANGRQVGTVTHFEGGTIYKKEQETHAMNGEILDLYSELGGPVGELGFPQTDIENNGHFDYCGFQRGIIVHRPGSKPFSIRKLRLFINKVNCLSIDDGWKPPFAMDKSAELITHTTIFVNGRAVADRLRKPARGHTGTTCVIEESWIIDTNAGTQIRLLIEAEDWDEISGNEYLGKYERELSLDNLFGLFGSTDRDGNYTKVAATEKGGIPRLETLNFTYSLFENPEEPDPGKHDREQYWWRSDNFGTNTLSHQQYADTFSNVENAPTTWDQIHNPFDSIYYEALYQSIAKGGNCFGMCLEAVYARLNRSNYPIPIHNHMNNHDDDRDTRGEEPRKNILEGFKVIINDKHAYQLGTEAIFWVLKKLLTGQAILPMVVYSRVQDNLNKKDWPIVSMYDLSAGKGHAVMPYRCQDGDGSQANPHKIFVADPNGPLWLQEHGDPTYIAIYSNNTFKYVGEYTHEYKSGNILADPFYLPNGLMYELPYHVLSKQPKTPIWDILLRLTGLLSGLFIVLGDAQSEQILGDGNDLIDMRDGQRRFRVNGIPGMAGFPLVDFPEGTAEFYACCEKFPENLRLQLRGLQNGRFDSHVVVDNAIVSVAADTVPGALDTFSIEGLRTKKLQVQVSTNQVKKTATVQFNLKPVHQTEFERQVMIDLPVVKETVSTVEVRQDQAHLLIQTPGITEPVNVTLDSYAGGSRRTLSFAVTPESTTETLRIRPQNWQSLASDVIVERLASPMGGIITRSTVKVQ